MDAGGTGGAQRHDSGGGAGESAGLTKMAATMERFVAVVKEEYHSVVCYIKQENTHSECALCTEH